MGLSRARVGPAPPHPAILLWPPGLLPPVPSSPGAFNGIGKGPQEKTSLFWATLGTCEKATRFPSPDPRLPKAPVPRLVWPWQPEPTHTPALYIASVCQAKVQVGMTSVCHHMPPILSPNLPEQYQTRSHWPKAPEARVSGRWRGTHQEEGWAHRGPNTSLSHQS